MGWIRRWSKWWLVVLLALAMVSLFILLSPVERFFWDHLTEKSGVLAAWVAAVATCVLIVGLWLTYQSMMRESALSAAFQRLYEQFNSPHMLHARASLAKTHSERVQKGGLDKIRDNSVPRQGWPLVNFLNQVGYLVETDRISFEDVLFAYGHHIQLICERWKHILTHECQEDRYKPLFDLCAQIENSPLRTVRNDIERTWEPAQEWFWSSEASLHSSAKSEDEQ